MAKHPHSSSPSEKTQAEALAVARSTQKPGQTKEQTKLIAQGIEKGISLYKKQQKAKAREQDKRQKKVAAAKHQPENTTLDAPLTPAASTRLPWLLLGISWGLFILYLVFANG